MKQKKLKVRFPIKPNISVKKKKRQFYNFYRDGVTQSMICKWLECPIQCYWEYVRGYTSHKNSDAIIFGNCIHHVLEQAYSETQMPMPGNVKSYVKEFEIKNNDENAPLAQQEQNEITYSKAEVVLRNYFIRYAKDFYNNWEIAEQVFKVPFKFEDGRTTYLNGKLDGGFIDSSTNKLRLMDHKCLSQINIDNLLILLPVDLQVNIYLWAVKEIRGLEDCPTGFDYNLIRNPASKPTKKDNTLSDFADRLSEKIELDMGHYFKRIPLSTTPDEITNWGIKTLTPILKSMREWADSGYKRFIWRNFYNPVALETKYGLAPTARIIAENDFTGFYQKTVPFEELVEC